jgi:tRNA(Ile)-lysidine synthase
VAQIRLQVRRSLAGLESGELVLAACSGGADSLALAVALAFEAPRLGLRGGGVTVDHGLQPGSAEQAGTVAEILRDLGLDPVLTVRAAVAGPATATGGPAADGPGRSYPATAAADGPGPAAGGPGRGYPGPEAAARAARYAALDQAAAATGAAAILLGHTRDDQAETVLLGLARGSGARSLAGMAPRSGRYLRPLLPVRRAQAQAACAAAGLQPWQDPHNSDPAYARVRVRNQILPMLEELLGPGITDALARSADQLRADCNALDCLADAEYRRLAEPGRDGTDPDGVAPEAPAAEAPAAEAPAAGALAAGALAAGALAAGALAAGALAALPAAIRTRLLRTAALAAGCPAGALTAVHIGELDALVTRWHGQHWVDLPGGVRCQRRYGRLLFTAAA